MSGIEDKPFSSLDRTFVGIPISWSAQQRFILLYGKINALILSSLTQQSEHESKSGKGL